jgi:toxin ParE1/3/4
LRRLVYSSAARRSLGELLEYLTIEMGAEALASPIVDRIRTKCVALVSLPTVLGRPRDDLSPGLRSFPFRGFVIFIRYSDETLEIVDILHSRRDPDAVMGESEH